ncbi:MAG: MFS transporter [Puniceicoccales bacterium]|jgi:MFS family permease|nr:MFS transporter [Puniceicoccales bacterium]
MQDQSKVLLGIKIGEEKTTFSGLSTGKTDIFSPSEKFFRNGKIEQKTLLFDGLRYLFQGALDGELQSVILWMVMHNFHMPVGCKIALTSIGFLSMIFAPISQQLANRSRWNNMQFSALYFALMGLAFFCAAFATSWVTFFIFIALARIFNKQQIPLVIGVYENNYSKVNRGFKSGVALACMPIGGIIFSQLASHFLDKSSNHLSYILFLASFLALCCALCFLKIPASKTVAEKYPPLWDNFKFIGKDHLFGAILFFYSFIAIANQMTLPLRIEYLANHKNLSLSSGTIVALFALVQPLANILSGPLWGKLYDRVSLITMRQCVTICFLIGIPLFFATDNLTMIYLASALLGIGASGGVIFWSLWVIGIAPRDKTSEYMSANVAIMGLRDALAPILGYYLLYYTSPFTVGVISFLLLVISVVGFEYISRQPAYGERISEILK